MYLHLFLQGTLLYTVTSKNCFNYSRLLYGLLHPLLLENEIQGVLSWTRRWVLYFFRYSTWATCVARARLVWHMHNSCNVRNSYGQQSGQVAKFLSHFFRWQLLFSLTKRKQNRCIASALCKKNGRAIIEVALRITASTPKRKTDHGRHQTQL